MLTPKNLKIGDTIGILSTARKFTSEQLEFCTQILNTWGFKVVIGSSINAEEHQFAGSDQLRADNLQAFIDDPNIDAILCARGGYGTMRIIDQIDFSKFIQNPKWISGFSDVTVLHQHLQSMGIASIHSSMPSLFPNDLQHNTLLSLENALKGNELNYRVKINIDNLRMKNVEAEIIGGNLSLIYALQGSASDINTNGKILFIEDLDEYFYHIDRMMCSLDRAGKLKNLAALVVGGMTDMKDNSIPFGMNVNEIIHHYTKKYNYPVLFDFPAGHWEKNYAIRLGQIAKIEIKDDEYIFSQK
ncbi:MAG: LD-carboxypeptidase [bacterium]|jgi:muramoyltetrapeptide carboxypeptidase